MDDEEEEEEKVRILGNEGKPQERCKLRIMEKEEENLEMEDVSFVLLAHAFVARLHTIHGHNNPLGLFRWYSLGLRVYFF